MTLRTENELKEALAMVHCIIEHEDDAERKRAAAMTQIILEWVLGSDNSFEMFYRSCSAAMPEDLKKKIHDIK